MCVGTDIKPKVNKSNKRGTIKTRYVFLYREGARQALFASPHRSTSGSIMVVYIITNGLQGHFPKHGDG